MQRIKNDFYPTEYNLTHELLLAAPEIGGVIFEPSSGQGHIADVLNNSQYSHRIKDVVTNDIDPRMPAHLGFDASVSYAVFHKTFPDYDWAVGNPPFSLAHEIIPNCLRHAERGAAMLLRLSYLEPTMKRNARGNFLKKYADCMRYQIVIGDPRPSFRADTKGTDSVTTMWIVWDKHFSWAAHGLECPFRFLTGWKS